MQQQRRYDLDALRAFAMFLGVVLHACTNFVPHYTPGDPQAELVLARVTDVIHGFRMPLFFLVSGYFTALLWQRRGLGGVVRQRVERVLLPWLVALFTVLPALEWGFTGGKRLAGVDAAPPAHGGFPLEPAAVNMGHLWFLWMLCHLVALFALVVGVVRLLGPRLPGLTHPAVQGVAVLALVALTVVTQFQMPEAPFGPAFTDTFVMERLVVAYYAGFFGVGAFLYVPGGGMPTWLERLRPAWPVFAVAAVACLVAGWSWEGTHTTASHAVQVAYAWLGILALVGLFHLLFSHGRGADPRVRWLSDASYWTYLIHFPAVLILQGFLGGNDLPFWLTVPLVTLGALAISLVSYQYLVRYTALGAFLNGWRSRESSPTPRPALARTA
ncbi:acyltransferase family protein [Kytococcus sedentarius]|uniref:acyltransferase family protein n=1 Tax=Kytococcus sedentarius TaxID=1276 RepID=UPI0035BBD739